MQQSSPIFGGNFIALNFFRVGGGGGWGKDDKVLRSKTRKSDLRGHAEHITIK